MASNKRFLAKNGVDNNNNTISNVTGIEGAGDVTISRAGSTLITVGATDVNIANNITISNASARAYVNAEGGSPQVQFLRSSTLDALIGSSSTTDNTITGSSAGDLCLRTVNNDILFSTDNGSSSQLFLSAAGRTGLGTTSPYTKLHVRQSAVAGISSVNNDGILIERGGGVAALNIASDNTQSGAIWFADPQSLTAGGIQYLHSSDALAFRANAAERVRIDSSGRTLVGVSASRTNGGVSALLQVEGIDSSASVGIAKDSADATGPYLMIGKTRSATTGGSTSVQVGDVLGTIQFNGADGNDLSSAGAAIQCRVDGTPGLDDMPGRLVFMTTPDGSNGPTERMRIDATGNVSIGGVAPSTRLRVFSSSGQIIDVDGSNTTTGAIDTGAGITFTGHDGSSARTFAQIFAGKTNATVGDYSSYLTFSTRSNGGPLGVERMRITSAGNVLIGTTSDDGINKLQVSGGTSFVFSSTDRMTLNYNTNDTTSKLVLMYRRGTGAGSAAIGQYVVGDGSNGVSQVRFTSDTSNVLTIGRTNVLIGTATDDGINKLQISGTASLSGDNVVISTAKTPASATATGTTGMVCWDANYVYVCVATNTWKRSALSTW